MQGASIIKLLYVVTSLTAVGCGGGFKVGSPWNPGEANFFDDGIDLIEEPSKLGGQWSYNYEEALDARVNLGDLVALVEVGTVHTTTDIDRVEAKRIGTTINEVLIGSTPEKQIFLQSSKASIGYSSILRHENHLSGEFIVFVRWFELDDGALGHHFHLSPASTELRKDVQNLVDKRIREEERLKVAN